MYALKSDTLLSENKLKEAELAIRTAIELDNGNYIAYNNLGMLNKMLGKSEDEILNPILKSISLNDRYLVAIFNLTIVYYEFEQYQNSIFYCNNFLELANDNKELNNDIGNVYGRRGECKSQLGNYEDAIIDLNLAIKYLPNEPGLYKELGNAYRNLEFYKEAMDYYLIAIKLDSNYAQAYNGLAICYDDGFKELENAVKYYSISIKLDSTSDVYYLNRGACLFDHGQYQKALPDLLKAKLLGNSNTEKYLSKYN